MHGVVFDLDETLIDRYRAVTNFAEDLWVNCFSKVEEVPESFVSQVHQIDGYGYVPRDQFFKTMVECFSESLHSKEVVEDAFYQQVWETPQLAEGVVDCLQFLQAKGVPLAIVTNGSTKAQEAKISNSGIAGYFTAVIISEAFGVKKPDPSIYKAAASRLNASPGDCWFVGDHPVNDIWGSKQAGFSTAWVHLNRPWSSEIQHCYDKKGATFRSTMDQILENI